MSKKMQLDDMELAKVAGGTLFPIRPIKPTSPVTYPSKPVFFDTL